MAKTSRKLTARSVETLGPGRHFDGGGLGLMLHVQPGGSRSWLQRVTIGGQRRELGLGSPPVVTLAMAREAALANMRLVREGKDPLVEKRRARAVRQMTFREAAEHVLSVRAQELSNDKHKAQWRSTLETYAFPVLGDMPVGAIEVADILRVLEPIWTSKNETASRVRGRVESVLTWATVAGHRSGDNPARWRGNLDHFLPRSSKVTEEEHQPALAQGDAVRWFAALRRREGVSARALEFIAYTVNRSGVVRKARWSDIDFDRGFWVIPAPMMKAKREHRVALSTAALELLHAMPRLGEFVFPSPRGDGPLSDMTPLSVMRRIHAEDVKTGGGFFDPVSKRPAVPHGLRSTFRDWATERGIERDLAELCLAHDIASDVERAYRRSDMLERRRAVMDRWAGFLAGSEAGGASVVALGQPR